jgi:hypothetical protein
MIEVKALAKKCGRTTAVDATTFDVGHGEMLRSFLGQDWRRRR